MMEREQNQVEYSNGYYFEGGYESTCMFDRNTTRQYTEHLTSDELKLIRI